MSSGYPMFEQRTKDVVVRVEPEFLADQSSPAESLELKGLALLKFRNCASERAHELDHHIANASAQQHSCVI